MRHPVSYGLLRRDHAARVTSPRCTKQFRMCRGADVHTTPTPGIGTSSNQSDICAFCFATTSLRTAIPRHRPSNQSPLPQTWTMESGGQREGARTRQHDSVGVRLVGGRWPRSVTTLRRRHCDDHEVARSVCGGVVVCPTFHLSKLPCRGSYRLTNVTMEIFKPSIEPLKH